MNKAIYPRVHARVWRGAALCENIDIPGGWMVRFAQVGFVVVVLILLQGCALSRSVVVPDGGVVPENSAEGTAVRIERIDDVRRFEAAPNTPDVSSLAGSDIQNAELRARAIARKRNTFGAAIGDIVLPEGRTVSDVMNDTLTRAFRLAGYRVLTANDAGYAQAVPVQAHINEFWAWFNPGAFTVTLSNRIDVTLAGSLPALKEGATIRNETSEQVAAAFEDNWRRVISKGLSEFSEKARVVLATKP